MRLYKINKNISMFIPSGTPMLNANVYFIRDKINAIIDTGTSTTLSKERILNILKSLDMDKIDKILITHTHHDHCANAGLIEEIFDSEIIAHPKAVSVLKKDNLNFDLKDFEFLEFLEHSIPFLNKKRLNNPAVKNFIRIGYNLYQGRIKKVKDVTPTKDNQVLSFGDIELKVIHTPGHSHDSVCLYEPKKRIIFTGDMVPFTPYIQSSIETMRKSIRKIMNLYNIKFVFRSHGYRFHPWCEEFPIYLEFLDSFERAKKRIVHALKKKGPLKIRKIVPRMYERAHTGHHRFYRLMRTDTIWALRYLQDLEKIGLVICREDGKYQLK